MKLLTQKAQGVTTRFYREDADGFRHVSVKLPHLFKETDIVHQWLRKTGYLIAPYFVTTNFPGGKEFLIYHLPSGIELITTSELRRLDVLGKYFSVGDRELCKVAALKIKEMNLTLPSDFYTGLEWFPENASSIIDKLTQEFAHKIN